MEAQEQPVLIRPMSREEKVQHPNWSGFADTFPLEGPRHIALDMRQKAPERISTFVHEHGHVAYPVEITGGLTEKWTRAIFSELCANYHQLRYKSVDRGWVKRKINKLRDEAGSRGFTKSQTARLEKLARNRVGYRGPRVSRLREGGWSYW